MSRLRIPLLLLICLASLQLGQSSSCSPGSMPSGTSCTQCGAGQYGPDGLVCDNCQAGTWSSQVGATSPSVCQPCHAGTWSSATGASSPSVCTACNAGTFSSQVGASSSSVCQQCDAGTWSSGSQSVCTACGAGSWSSQVGATSRDVCQDCTPGTWSSATGASSQSACTACNAGTFGAEVGASSATVCQQCGAGTWSSSGQSSCTFCTAGTWSNTPAATTSSACQQCAAGTWSPTPGATSQSTCAVCPAGSFSSQQGASSSIACQQCAAGTWSSEGQTVCTKCVAGTWSSTPAATADSTCRACLPGSWSTTLAASSIATCINCTAGTFSATLGASLQSTCTVCPIGQFSGGAGATTCTACGLGRFTPRTGTSACKQCAPGSYADRIGQTVCALCEAGSFSDATGATNSSVCLGCASGYISNAGAKQCQGCGHGTNNGRDNTACVQCEPLQANCIGNGLCSNGSTGHYCSTCLEDYYPLQQFCEKCSPVARYITPVLGILIFMLAALLIKLGLWHPNVSAVLRTQGTFIQLIDIQLSFAIPWPRLLQQIAAKLIAMFSILQIESPDCIVRLSWYANFWGFLGLCAGLLVMPFVIRAFVLCAGRYCTCCRRRHTMWGGAMRLSATLMDAWGNLAMLLYEPVLKTLLQPFSCLPDPKFGDVFAYNTSLGCDSVVIVTHKVIAGMLAVLIGIVVPVAIGFTLYRLQRDETLHIHPLGRALKPFYNSYKDTYRYAECWILARKAAAVLLLLAPSTWGPVHIQPLAQLLLSAVYLAVVWSERPWMPVTICAKKGRYQLHDVLNKMAISLAASDAAFALCGVVVGFNPDAVGGVAGAVLGLPSIMMSLLLAFFSLEAMIAKRQRKSTEADVELAKLLLLTGVDQRIIGLCVEERQRMQIELDQVMQELKDLNLNSNRWTADEVVRRRREAVRREAELRRRLVDPRGSKRLAALLATHRPVLSKQLQLLKNITAVDYFDAETASAQRDKVLICGQVLLDELQQLKSELRSTVLWADQAIDVGYAQHTLIVQLDALRESSRSQQLEQGKQSDRELMAAARKAGRYGDLIRQRVQLAEMVPSQSVVDDSYHALGDS